MEMASLVHFHLTLSGVVCILSLWGVAGTMSFHDPFEGTEISNQKRCKNLSDQIRIKVHVRCAASQHTVEIA